MSALVLPGRRLFLATAALGAAHWTVRGAFADDLTRTPKQTEGPFYPDKLPLDTDNDLLVLNDSLTPAVGTVAHLTGTVTDLKGTPLRNTLVEVWQCDNNGVYLHSADSTPKAGKQDKQFQGFGRFLTGSKGEYYFRTIKPVPYPGRTPHIHVKVKQGGKELLCTQCYNLGEKGNARDGVIRAIKDPKQLAACMVDWQPVAGSKAGEVQGRFDIVLGITPAEKG
jgi:protocatechuate 3,4-dioxygenase beta subunit